MASKSAQQEPEKAEVIEEALDLLDQNLDRVKVLYEQYFLGIQKQPPQFLHTDVERKLRDAAQLQIRNTALRYRLVTLQQKFGSYNAYWRRTLRQIENGTYLRNLSKLTRQAAQTGEEIPEEILAAMPKRMREQVRRDREAALAMAARRGQIAEPGTSELTLEGQDPFDPPTDQRRKTPKTAGGAHIIDDGDGDLDLDAFFAEMEKNTTRPPPISDATPARRTPPRGRPSTQSRARARDRETGAMPAIGRTKTHSSSPSGAHPAIDPNQPARSRTPTGQVTPATGQSPVVGRPRQVTPPGQAPLAKAPPTAPAIGRSDTERDVAPDFDPPTDLRRPVAAPPAASQKITPPIPRPAPPPPPGSGQPPARRPAAETTPFVRPPVPPPTRPERPQTSPVDVTFKPSPTIAPSQVTRPNPVIAGSSATRPPVPVESMSGPFPRTPIPQPNVPRPPVRAPQGRATSDPGARTPPPQRISPPPGMTDADVNALYAKYVKAKEMVGETAGPGAYGKLLQTINSQAPKIMEQYKARGVDFTVVVKDNQVIIRAKPKP